MRLSVCLSAALAVVFGAASVAEAGAWPKKKGASYTKLSLGADRETEGWDDTGRRDVLGSAYNPATFRQRSAYLYSEYGLTDRITGVALIGVKRLQVEDRLSRSTTTGLADIYLGLKGQFASVGPAVFSLQLGGLLPTNYRRDFSPPVGPGQYSAEGRLLAGVSLYPIPAYASAEFGYQRRTERYFSRLDNANAQSNLDRAPFNDELPYAFEAGYTVAGRVLLRAAFDGQIGLGETKYKYTITSAPRKQSYFRLAPSVIVTATPWLQLNLDYGHVVSGTSTAATDQVALGAAVLFGN